jgi:hypothetical protein
MDGTHAKYAVVFGFAIFRPRPAAPPEGHPQQVPLLLRRFLQQRAGLRHHRVPAVAVPFRSSPIRETARATLPALNRIAERTPANRSSFEQHSPF